MTDLRIPVIKVLFIYCFGVLSKPSGCPVSFVVRFLWFCVASSCLVGREIFSGRILDRGPFSRRNMPVLKGPELGCTREMGVGFRFVQTQLLRSLDLHHPGVVDDDLHDAKAHRLNLALNDPHPRRLVLLFFGSQSC